MKISTIKKSVITVIINTVFSLMFAGIANADSRLKFGHLTPETPIT